MTTASRRRGRLRGRTRTQTLIGTVLILSSFGGCVAIQYSGSESRFLAVDATSPASDAGIVTLDQGWTAEQARWFYDESQGSQVVPYDWFLHLERADGTTLLRDPASMAGFGFIPREPGADNEDGLPIGFVRDEGRSRDWLGLTCAACHTGRIDYEGTALLIDGGPTMADLEALLRALVVALQATLEDAAKLERFTAAVIGADADDESRAELRTELRDVTRFRREFNERNLPTDPARAFGPGRYDAFNTIVNEVGARFLRIPENARPPAAPVSYPALWDTPHHDRVQWNGVAKNEGLGDLGRNVGQVMGVFGNVEIPDRLPLGGLRVFGFASTVRIRSLEKLEKTVESLQSPLWPDAFPPIDEALAAQGAKVYGTSCAVCHPVIDRTDPDRTIVANLRDVGTDSTMADAFGARTVLTGPLEGEVQDYDPFEKKFGPTASAKEVLVHVVIGTMLGRFWRQPEDEDLGSLLLTAPVATETDAATDAAVAASTTPRTGEPALYKARPLNGIWASAPYLHNGSVPTLADMLLPAAERPEVFWVGRREFDPERVGFRVEEGPGLMRFDTSVPGNGNGGHELAARLTEEERRALLEYLKSL